MGKKTWKVISYIQIKSNQIQCYQWNITGFNFILDLNYIRKQKNSKQYIELRR